MTAKFSEIYISTSKAHTSKPFYNTSGTNSFFSNTNQLQQTGFIQPKFSIGHADDPYEREADKVAEEVIRMPDKALQMKCTSFEDQDKIRQKPLIKQTATSGNSNFSVSAEISNKISSTRGLGSPLPTNTQHEMGNKIGADFSDVKVHTDNTAVQLSQNLGAKAFTVGNDIYFNEGQYKPTTTEGKRLMAHELVHTVQQDKSQFHLMRQTESNSSNVQESFKLSGQAVTYLPYKVKPNDTLSAIADRFDVEGGWRTIAVFSVNDGLIEDSNQIIPNQLIAIPYQSIRNLTEANHYDPEKEVQIEESDNQSQTERYPRQRRVEIKVDPTPVVFISIPIYRDSNRFRIADAETIVMAEIRAGNEDMVTAMYAAVGRSAREGLWNDLTSFRSWIYQTSTVVEEEFEQSHLEHTLDIYIEHHTTKTRNELIDQHSTKPPEPPKPRSIDPEQELYFEFDSTAFNEEMTTEEDWQLTVNQLAIYIEEVNRHKEETPYISLEGYASWIGSEEYNQQLSMRRAEVVEQRLHEELSQRGLNNYVILAIGRGMEEFYVY